MRKALVVALAALTFAAIHVGAQTWHTAEFSRQAHDSGEQQVRVEYGAGTLDVRPADQPVLYAMQLRYDDDDGRPVHRYSAADHSLTLGITHQALHMGRHVDRDHHGEMRLELSRTNPLSLDFALAATEARIDLGGLALRTLRVEADASDAKVDFDAPNATPLGEIDVDVNAAAFEADHLANANTSLLRVKGGVGSVDLDFRGQWVHDVAFDGDIAIGKVSLHVPEDVGIRITVDKVIASFDHRGLVDRGDAYYSTNWERSSFKLRARARVAFGSIEVDRSTR